MRKQTTDPKVLKLSPRERAILQSIMSGDPNKVIARKLDVAEATVKVHVKAILRKIGAANRAQAAMWAAGHLGNGSTSNGRYELTDGGLRLRSYGLHGVAIE